MISFTSNGITFRIAFPDYPANVFVDHFVVMEGTPSGHEERLFPNNKSEIFFNLGDGLTGQAHAASQIFHLTGSVVSGTRHTYFSFQPGARLCMAGFRFTLFGFHLLWGMPAHHFTDHNFDAADVWGKEMEWVREQLHQAADSAGRIRVMHDWVIAKIPEKSFPEVRKWKQVEQQILQRDMPVAHFLEKTLGYSHKHSLQLIKEKCGLTPKAIQKVNRFDRALRILNRRASVDWADLALEAGYSDQSHFIRDFRRFTGYTPAVYLDEKPRIYRLYEQMEPPSDPAG